MRLDSERLILREFVDEDWRATQEYESDPEALRYQEMAPMSPEESREYIRRARADAWEVPRRTWDLAVVLQKERRLIGRAGLHATNLVSREATVWFIVVRELWGSGYATEAVMELLRFGFEDLKLHRIVADCDPRNLGSVRVLEKAGMRREAHFVESTFLKGEWCDSLVYAILDREWRAR
jgi:RimJ/RimL family protein N-acetyltransferase